MLSNYGLAKKIIVCQAISAGQVLIEECGSLRHSPIINYCHHPYIDPLVFLLLVLHILDITYSPYSSRETPVHPLSARTAYSGSLFLVITWPYFCAALPIGS